MAVLIDSNVLVFSIQKGKPRYEESVGALEVFLSAGETACVFLQNVAEFWNVCTRPVDKNGLGLSTAETERQLGILGSLITVLPDPPNVYAEWRRLVALHDVKGVQVHDARLAACMVLHGIQRILTYNPTDFKRFRGVAVLHPRDVC